MARDDTREKRNTNDKGCQKNCSNMHVVKSTAPRTTAHRSRNRFQNRLRVVIVMPCAAQIHRNLQASHLAANSRLSAKLPVPVGKTYRRHICRATTSQIGAVEKAQVQAKRRPEYVPGRIDDPSYVRIFDTTLRDGEQSPGLKLGRCSIIIFSHRHRHGN